MPLKTERFYHFGAFRLDSKQRLLWNGGNLVPLSLKALETLLVLVENPGRLVEKDELMKRLWPDTFVEENNLAFNISVLRKALTDGQSGFAYIETIPRRGYRFVAPVTETGAPVPGQGAGTPLAPSPAGTRILPVGGSNETATDGIAAGPVPVSESGHARAKARGMPWLVAVAGAVLAAVAGCVCLLVRPLPPATAHNPRPLTNDGLAKECLGTDGQRLYFTERVSTGDLVLKQMSVNGGESEMMSAPGGNLGALDLSPDDSSILLSGSGDPGGSIWILPLPTGSPRLLGTLMGRNASWSPDGQSVVFCWGREVWVANQDGSNPRRVAVVTGNAWWPRWSPDGTRLRFAEAGPSSVAAPWYKLWGVSTDGAHLRPVLPRWKDAPGPEHGSWTPDGKYFVFDSTNEGKVDIWAIREKGGGIHWRSAEPMKLTDLSQNCAYPVFGPDNKRLFFVGSTARGSLEYLSPAEKQFVPFLDGISAEPVAYSSDGDWVAYVKYPEGTLWRMRSNRTESRELTFLPMKVHDFAWSPDGTQIAFSAATPTNPYENYLVQANGNGEPRKLQPGHHEREGIPSWSPNGRQMAFGDVPEKFGQGNKGNVIHVLDLLTGHAEALPRSEGFWSPRWSPDGRYIAALKDDDPNPDRQPLFVYDRKTKEWIDLHVDHVAELVWAHDGKHIYYDGESGHEGIFRVRLPDGRPEPVASTDNVLRALEHWFGLTPKDSPLILRDAGSEEIYSVDVDWR
ncbi:MAG TPA: winged helix-turn-helix domain-containing protein [Terriglobia bacterium]|jgi:Tol biopolymer transport system component/DNA-binding winged helix-turn-helix (wHTH) protein|nr:winged helix-turn-helix domain-containing protein [Terriglobia bacterium]